ncbi:MAG TPA: hypothetical protein VM487_22010 [Phycisphaerae bacterium]|nr:hypothetical protein [Phycisphaerae bacterium]
MSKQPSGESADDPIIAEYEALLGRQADEIRKAAGVPNGQAVWLRTFGADSPVAKQIADLQRQHRREIAEWEQEHGPFDPPPLTPAQLGTIIEIVNRKHNSTSFTDRPIVVGGPSPRLQFYLDVRAAARRMRKTDRSLPPVPPAETDPEVGLETIEDWIADAQASRRSRPPRVGQWTPPKGYVSTTNIKHDDEFRKDGKNPSRTTIEKWQERDPPKKIVKDPATGENWYPRTWAMKHVKAWSPRNSGSRA